MRYAFLISTYKLKAIVFFRCGAYTCVHSPQSQKWKTYSIGTGPDRGEVINLPDHMQPNRILLVIMRPNVLELVKGPSSPANNELPYCRAHRVIWLHCPNGEIISNQFQLSYGAFGRGEDLIRTLGQCQPHFKHIFGALRGNAIAAMQLMLSYTLS